MSITLSGYDIGDKIYDSANSLVYRAVRAQDGLPVVMKLLKENFPTPETLIRYKQEFDILQSLRLERVVKAYQLQKYQNTLALIVEDFEGISLQQWMPAHPSPLGQTLHWGIALCQALGQIHHAGIIHKDISPGNVVINPNTQVLKLIDFGISTRFSRQTPTLKSPDTLEGTLTYMAPEQTGRMNRALDYRADFYSLGVILYELLTGHPPFMMKDRMELVYAHLAQEPVPPHEVNGEIPEAFSAIVMKLLEKTAEKRYQSAWGIQADLEACRDSLTTLGHMESFSLAGSDVAERF